MSSVGELERASHWLEKVSELVPIEAAVFERVAHAAQLVGDFDPALAALQRAADRRLDRVESLIRYANEYAAGPDAGDEILVATDDHSVVGCCLGPDVRVWRRAHAELPHMDCIQTLIAKPAGQQGRQLLVDDDPHAARITAWSTSRAA
jgi:hypothetical protein